MLLTSYGPLFEERRQKGNKYDLGMKPATKTKRDFRGFREAKNKFFVVLDQTTDPTTGTVTVLQLDVLPDARPYHEMRALTIVLLRPPTSTLDVLDRSHKRGMKLWGRVRRRMSFPALI